MTPEDEYVEFTEDMDDPMFGAGPEEQQNEEDEEDQGDDQEEDDQEEESDSLVLDEGDNPDLDYLGVEDEKVQELLKNRTSEEEEEEEEGGEKLENAITTGEIHKDLPNDFSEENFRDVQVSPGDGQVVLNQNEQGKVNIWGIPKEVMDQMNEEEGENG